MISPIDTTSQASALVCENDMTGVGVRTSKSRTHESPAVAVNYGSSSDVLIPMTPPPCPR